MTNKVNIISEEEFTDEEIIVLEKLEEFLEDIINKDIEKLDKTISKYFILTHMSGKKQSKEEFMDELGKGILNYYEAEITNPKIKIDDNISDIIADITLNAKVYEIKGAWTLSSILTIKQSGNNYYIQNWKT